MNITLYVPHLFGPNARFSEEYIPRAESLEFLLGRAQKSAWLPPTFHRSLCKLFAVAVPADRDVPVAALTRLIDADEHDAGCWMRADPVHLRADRHGLTLLDARALNLDMREALALAADLQDFMKEEGWQLEVPHPERWYVRLDRAPAVHTRELDDVVGGNVADALPSGEEAAGWHALLNEIQMSLHHCDVNQVRETRNLAQANSLWLWGIGALPPAPAPRWWKVYADDISTRACARFAGTPSAPLPPDVLDLPAGVDPVLVVADACKHCVEYQDLQGWNDAVTALEEHWFKPCLQMLRSGVLKKLELITGGRQFVISRTALHFFWRRPMRLASQVSGT